MHGARKKRVIVDTNCWISFLIGRRLSSLAALLNNNRIELVLCEELLEELREVTQRPKFAKYFPAHEVDSLLSFLHLKGRLFEPSGNVHICRDEEDNYLLALAMEAKAHYIVTGDKDLLVIKEVASCRIVDAKAFEDEMCGATGKTKR